MAKKQQHVLNIKHMVCPRCVTVVQNTLEELNVSVRKVALGEAIIETDDEISESCIDEKLREHGFELIYDRDQKQTKKIKEALHEYLRLVEESDESPRVSDYLSGKLHQSYSSLSSAFSDTEDITIEKYLIRLKIERVKALLKTGELTLSEIAWRLNYSSVAHLSGQFKQVMGMSPTDYQKKSNPS